MSSATTETAPNVQPSRARRLARVLLMALAFGTGTGLVLFLTVLVVRYYHNLPVPTREWPKLQLPNLGVNASLKTRWSDGSLKYQFSIVPDKGLEDAFGQVAHDKSNIFVVHLIDQDGFELCNFSPKLTVTVSDAGKATGLTSNEDSFACSRTKVENANNWHLTFVFPRLSELKLRKDSTKPEPAKNDKIDMSGVVAYSDWLTGIDFDGHVETKNGYSFVISREAEKGNAYFNWQINASLSFTCRRRTDCVINNLDNGQTVHARLNQ